MTVSVLSFALVALAALLFTLVRPRWALLLPLIFHPLYLVRTSIGPLPTTGLEVLIVLAVVTGVVVWRSELFRSVRALPRSVVILILLFIVAATLSAWVAPHPRTAWGQWKAFVIEPVAYSFVLLPFLRSPDGQRAVVRSLLAGGVLAAGLSLAVGIFAFTPFPLHPTPYTPVFSRLQGIYDVPNSLALILAPLAAFAATLASTSEQRGLQRFALGSFLVFVPVLLLSQSMAGLAAAVLGSVFGMWQSRKVLQHTVALARRHIALTGTLLGIVVVGLAVPWTTGRLTHALSASSPFHARLQIWQVSAELIRDHPVLGTGLGTFEPAYQAKLHELLRSGAWGMGPGAWGGRSDQGPGPNPRAPLEWVVRDPHNIILSFWLNTGLLGLLSMAGFVALLFRRPYALFTPQSPKGEVGHPTPYTLAAQAALAAALLFGLVDVPYFKNDLVLLWWISLFLPTDNGSWKYGRTPTGTSQRTL